MRLHRPRLGGALVLASVAIAVSAAQAASGGPDAAGYGWRDANSGCAAIADPFTLADSFTFAADDASTPGIPLGFGFRFYDRVVDRLWVHPAGLVFFEQPPAANLFANQRIPFAGDGVAGFVAPYWTSMLPGPGPHCWWEPTSTGFKVSFRRVPMSSWTGSTPVAWELYLERSGDIRIEYLDPGDATIGTIGIESFDEAIGLELGHDSSHPAGMTFGTPLPFGICIERARDLDCSAMPVIQCDVPADLASPASLPSNATSYGCSAGTWSGNERVLQLVVPSRSDLHVSLTGTGGRNMAAFVLADCSQWSCVAGGSAAFDWLLAPAGTYVIAVDAATAADEGPFTLAVTCGVPRPIACEETLAGSTAGESNRLDGYPCVAGDWSGPEALHEVDVTSGNLFVSVASSTGLVAFVFDAAMPLVPSNCLAGGTDSFVLYGLPSGRYVVVVDGSSASAGPFSLAVHCAPVIGCPPAGRPVICGDRIPGTTVGSRSAVDFYRCTTDLYDGPEAVLAFDVSRSQVVSFALRTPDPRLDLVLLDSCDEGSCVEAGDDRITTRLAAGTHHLAVDGREGAAAPFTILVDCVGCGLTQQWQWDGSTESPSMPTPRSTPLVVQLTDDDGDGRVGPGDTPDVVFVHNSEVYDPGRITALDGRDGSEIFTTTGPEVSPAALAAAELDGDGLVDLVSVAADGRSLLSFRHDGSLAWQVPIAAVAGLPTIAIADLDQDGSPEIVVDGSARAFDGSLRWQGTAGRGRTGGFSSIGLAVDLVPGRPGLEVVAGNTCYAADGTILWNRSDLPDGLASVGDLDADGSPEVILSVTNVARRLAEIHVLDASGLSRAPGYVAANMITGAPVTLVDLDGDGRLELVVAMGSSLDALEWTGTQLVLRWSAESPAGCCSSPTAFDVDGDGHVEILMGHDYGFDVIGAQTGGLLDTWPGTSSTILEVPAIADIDGDGRPEIVVVSGVESGFVTAYDCGMSVPTRCIWNQQTYHVTNVADDGTIPRVEATPWSVGAGWLVQESRECCGSALTGTPDLLGWSLRASHVGDVVSLYWPTGRALLAGEHHHVWKGYGATGFVMVNAEGDLSRTWIESDVSGPLQFFDVRIASACEIESLDDEPPGWDVPHP